MRTLNLWVLPNSGLSTASDLMEILRDFLKEHAEIKIDIHVKTAASLWRQLFLMLKDPETVRRPDLVQIPDTWSSILAHLGLLEDLTGVDPGLTLDRWWGVLKDHCSSDGPGAGRGIYSLPWWMEIRVLYYRRDIFQKMDVDAHRDLQTWSGLKEICREIARSGKRFGISFPIANSNPRESVSLSDLAPCVWSAGGEFFSSDNTRSLFQREESIKGISEYLQLLACGWMPLLGKSGLVPKNLFDGYCAMQFSGKFPRNAVLQSQQRAYIPAVAQNLGAVLLPRVGKTNHSVVSAQHLGLLKGTSSQGEAYKVLRYLSVPRVQERYAVSIGAFPCSLEGLAGGFWVFPRAYDRRRQGEDLRDVFLSSAEIARPLPSLTVMGSLEKIFDQAMENLVRAILHRSYDETLLRQELIHIAAEADYILSLYA